MLPYRARSWHSVCSTFLLPLLYLILRVPYFLFLSIHEGFRGTVRTENIYSRHTREGHNLNHFFLETLRVLKGTRNMVRVELDTRRTRMPTKEARLVI